MTAIERRLPPDLGVTLGGSASEGHSITLTRDGALSSIYGTADPDQARAFLRHCLKVLKADDERHFLLSIIRDMAPRDQRCSDR